MNVIGIIENYYIKDSDLYNLLISHSKDVARKALSIVDAHPELKADRLFIEEAAMLHDIGIFKTDAPSIYCFGNEPYLRHGIIGAEILRNEGFSRHALVCERHTGTGLTKKTIIEQKLPLPHKDFVPISIEEQIICFADCFFSKTNLNKEKTIKKVRKSLSKFGHESVSKFDEWCKTFL